AFFASLLSLVAVDAKPDTTQSPARPAPKGLRIVDQGDTEPRLKGYKTPEGFKVEIVAEAPVVVHPIALTFAADGTPFVLERRPPGPNDPVREVEETFTYKDGSKRKVVVPKKSTLDVVKALRDTQGKGVFDEAKVVHEDELS